MLWPTREDSFGESRQISVTKLARPAHSVECHSVSPANFVAVGSRILTAPRLLRAIQVGQEGEKRLVYLGETPLFRSPIGEFDLPT